MSKVMMMVSFELNSMDLLDEWKDMSRMITSGLQGVDGFISRDSLKGSDNKIYCSIKWDSKEQQESFRKKLEAGKEWPEKAKNFERLVNMKTMNSEFLEIL
jgi:heme-degrading monooxygenase HmoA